MTNTSDAESLHPDFQIRNAFAGSVVYPPGGGFGPRIQPDLQLVLLHTGSMSIEIDGVVNHVPTGHVALLKPSHREQYVFSKVKETWHRWISVSVEPLHDAATIQFAALSLFIPISDRMNQLTDLMLSLQRQDSAQSFKEVIAALGRSAILLFLTEHAMMMRGGHKHPAVLIAKQVIHQRYPEELDLHELSLSTRMSIEHLIRLFRRDEGVTPMQYLWSYRIKQGLDLLRGSGLTIGEIAERTGFKTSFHFARLVKKQTGQTPSEIRKNSWTLS
jgi:AraC-like DNA-binding protein